jgi:glycosyltransferase involved in cell wall biosynthesis
MRVAVIGPPFIEVPPRRYGGTELFIANLARELYGRGHEVIVYANGDSRLPCPVRSIYAHADWPQDHPVRCQLKNADHTAWAMSDASKTADIIHLNDLVGVPMTRFVAAPVALTIHHPHEPVLTEQYARYPDVYYVAIAHWLGELEPMPRLTVIPHGIPVSDYTYTPDKEDYVAFLGRMAPCKGPHLAIDAALRAGKRIRLAGEIQPVFRDYWDTEIVPRLKEPGVEYIGEADFEAKNALLAGASALLFPIQWDEPFGLVMIEAMACGTPVLAFAGGAVAEVVRDGVNGWICADVDEMARRAAEPRIAAAACRRFVESRFSIARMVDEYVDLYSRMLAGVQTVPNGVHEWTT